MTKTTLRTIPSTTADAPIRAPFLVGFAALHDAMRRDARRLPIAIDRARTTADAAAIASWYRAFRSAIEHHHRREDDLVWLELVRRDSTFAEHVASLAEDHHLLDAALVAVDDALAALASGRKGANGPAVAAADSLNVLLHDHLHREEDAAFDRLGRCYTAGEYRTLERQMAKGMTLADIAFVGPWSLDGLDPHSAVEMMAMLPAPLRVLVRTVFTRRYRRIAAPIQAAAS